MILTNGTFIFKEETDDSVQFDELGRPLVSSSAWSEPIPCNVQTLTDNRLSVYSGGEFRSVSIQILTSERIPLTTSVIKVSRNTDALGQAIETLGEFKVQSIEYLPYVDTVKILAL